MEQYLEVRKEITDIVDVLQASLGVSNNLEDSFEAILLTKLFDCLDKHRALVAGSFDDVNNLAFIFNHLHIFLILHFVWSLF